MRFYSLVRCSSYVPGDHLWYERVLERFYISNATEFRPHRPVIGAVRIFYSSLTFRMHVCQ